MSAPLSLTPMDAANKVAEWLAADPHGSVEAGLSEDRLHRAEDLFGLAFPPLWRAVLGLVHPIRRYVAVQSGYQSPSNCPDWRLRDEARTRLLIDAPAEGVLFDVEENGFWWNAWGNRPEQTEDRLVVARQELARVPTLIPLFGYLYIAGVDDSPVFRIIQADVGVSAVTLADLTDDRAAVAVAAAGCPVGQVPFWSELHAYSQWRGSDSRFASLGIGGF